jgi:hypothetical protein
LQNAKTKTECWEKLDRLYSCFVDDHGEECARKIFETIMRELGDDRITISFAYYKRVVRDRQLRKGYRVTDSGGNYEELALLHDVSVKTVYRAVHESKE